MCASPPGGADADTGERGTTARCTLAGDIRIGISGWRYPPWRGAFYPGDSLQRRELEFASRACSTASRSTARLYSLQRPLSYAAWHDATPDDFVFAVKGPRFVTHTC
jgi:uncharacterized protein YecE (DUF72 family)